MDGASPEGIRHSSSLPTISEKTRETMKQKLGLEFDQKTAAILQGITGEPRRLPHELMGGLTEEVFSDLLSTNRDMLEILNQFVKKRSPHYSQTMLHGMAFILGVFNVETESGLMIRLSELPPETNYLQVVSQVVESIPALPQTGQITTIDRLFLLPSIPDHQTSLLGLMRELNKTNVVSFDIHFREGASIMYKVLGVYGHYFIRLNHLQWIHQPHPLTYRHRIFAKY